MNLVYISGKYSGETQEEVNKNIEEAEKYAIELANRNVGFICPHLNTRNFEQKSTADYEFYMDMYLELVSKCNGILMLPRWEGSSGARRELKKAREVGLNEFYPESVQDNKVFDEIKIIIT